MPILEWDIPFEVLTPYGESLGSDVSLLLNQDLGDGSQFRLNPANCVSRRGIRAVADPIPQGDGMIFHDRWAEGCQLQLAIQLWEQFPSEGGVDGKIACDAKLCEMGDLLYGHLWSLLRPPDDGGRVIWDPSCPGADRRLLDAVRLLALEDPQEGEQGVVEIRCTLDSPFPYAVSFTQQIVNVNGIQTITNEGNVEFWPVIKMNGDGGTITNNTTGQELVFLGGCLGGGSYIEIDTFRGTAYVDGDQANAKPCLDNIASEFFPLIPGDNSITTDVSCDFLVNDAWA